MIYFLCLIISTKITILPTIFSLFYYYWLNANRTTFKFIGFNKQKQSLLCTSKVFKLRKEVEKDNKYMQRLRYFGCFKG